MEGIDPRRNPSRPMPMRGLALLGAAVVLAAANDRLLFHCAAPRAPYFDAASEIPAGETASEIDRNSSVAGDPPLPTVACFFMVDHKSTDTAISVRYSHWAKRCSRFVIVSNGVGGGERYLDDNTILVDIGHLVEVELSGRETSRRKADKKGDNSTGSVNATSYATFPSPGQETKENLSLKSFYSWMYVVRKFGDDVDYIMKADPDTYMLMENYLGYLSRHFAPNQHAYIGRVFKTGGNFREPFVTGLSCTLSRTTAKLLVSKSTIHKTASPYPECTAEAFEEWGTADDHRLSVCLSSMGVYPAYTRDELGRERFLHFDPIEHVYGNDNPPQSWYHEWSFTPHRPRSKCCSEEACAFHYVKPERQNGTLVWDEVFGLWHWRGVGR